MSRRKGTPCACDCANDCADPCGNKVRKINGIPPDSNGNFIVEAGNGIGISTGENKITIINQSMASSFVAGDNIEINPSGDNLEIRLIDNPVINGTLQVNGDIIQQGAAYETHAEKVYTTNDYIYMRDGAIAGLGAGDFSGFQVKLYDGVNDGRLVIDNSGVARVGDVGDEQPLLTRSESGSLTNDHLLQWDGVNLKAIDSGKTILDLALANDVAITSFAPTRGAVTGGYLNGYKIGHIVVIEINGVAPNSAGDITVCSVPYTPITRFFTLAFENNVKEARPLYTSGTNIGMYIKAGDSAMYGTIMFVTND